MNAPKRKFFLPVVIFDLHGDETVVDPSFREPLLKQKEAIATKTETKRIEEEANYFTRQVKIVTTLFGFLVGCGSQRLFLPIFFNGLFGLNQLSPYTMALTWTLATCIMAFVVLMILRWLAVIPMSKEAIDLIGEHLLTSMDYLFIVGALFGVCFQWSVVDVLLGYKSEIYFNLAVLFVSLVCCNLVMKYASATNKQQSTTKKSQPFLYV